MYRATKILTMEQIGTLFSNVEILAQYMQDLIRAFLAAEKDGTLNNSIGSIFHHCQNYERVEEGRRLRGVKEKKI